MALRVALENQVQKATMENPDLRAKAVPMAKMEFPSPTTGMAQHFLSHLHLALLQKI
jgi:hypothetical protein